MAHTIQETLDAVKAEDAGVDSIVAFTNGLKQQLKDALANQMTPEIQAGIDAVFDSATANAAKLNTAINAPAVVVP